MTKNKTQQKQKSGITERNKLIRDKAVKVLSKVSPLTTNQIITKLCEEHNIGYRQPTSRQLSAYMSKDLRFKKVKIKNRITRSYAMWELAPLGDE